MNQTVHDVAIIGGGIGGSILAAILARNGVDVVLIEGSPHPRFAIGESTVPETSFYTRLLADRYGVPEIANLSSHTSVRRIAPTSGVKRNFGYVLHHEGEPARADEMAQAPTTPPPFGPDAHYFRQDVDAYLYNVAIRYGAIARSGTRVKEIDFTSDVITLLAENSERIVARYVVDAGGRGALIPRQLGLRDTEPRFMTRSRSLFTHMTDVLPWDAVGPSRKEHGLPMPFHQGTLHHLFDGGWMWVIPFDNHRQSSNTLCSVGINLDIDKYPHDPETAGEREFWQVIERFPSIKAQFAHAAPARPFVASDRNQFSTQRIVGDRYCLLPHAAEFVDPLNSTGMLITVSGINALAHRLIDASRDRDFSTERFTYVEEWTKKSFDTADRIAWCMYTSFSGDIRLVNAGFRTLTLPALYSNFTPLDVWARYRRTKDPHVFDRLEQSPLRGVFSADNLEIQTFLSDSVDAFLAYKSGTQTADDTVSAVVSHPILRKRTPPAFGSMTNPDSRLLVGKFAIGAQTRFLYWSRYRAPTKIGRTYLSSAIVPYLFTEAARSLGRQLRQAYDSVHPYTRDYLRLWNDDWQAHTPDR